MKKLLLIFSFLIIITSCKDDEVDYQTRDNLYYSGKYSAKLSDKFCSNLTGEKDIFFEIGTDGSFKSGKIVVSGKEYQIIVSSIKVTTNLLSFKGSYTKEGIECELNGGVQKDLSCGGTYNEGWQEDRCWKGIKL